MRVTATTTTTRVSTNSILDTYIHIVDKTITDDAPNHFGYYFKSDGANNALEFPGNTDISYVESSTDFTPAFVEDISFTTSAGTVVSVPLHMIVLLLIMPSVV